MKKVIVVTVVLGIIVMGNWGVGEEPKPTTQAERITQLIQQLGDDDWQKREQTQKELTEIGKKLVGEYHTAKKDKKQEISNQLKSEIEQFAKALQEADQGKDPEIKMRANQIRQCFYTLAKSKILFNSTQDRGILGIYIVDTDGKNQKKLTDRIIGIVDGSAVWCPDGTKIAFVSRRDGNDEIYVMDADGKNRQRLTKNLTNDVSPAWSPDNTKIIFTANLGKGCGDDDIYVIDTDGKNLKRLTDNQGNHRNLEPNWSPDGIKIAFDSSRDNSYPQIYVMNADGKNQQRLTEPKLANNTSPSWNPVSFPELSELFTQEQEKK